MIQSQEYSLYHGLYIYKSDVLTLESYSKVNMLLDALCTNDYDGSEVW